VYVADTGNRRLQVFDLLGNWLAAWGGSETELFIEPTGIDVGPAGNVFVADAGAARVIVLTPAGVPLFDFGGAGDGPGSFRAPVDVAVAEDGRVFVVDEVRQVVERYRILRDARSRQ
jgi:DNA-binding beta-propeller fold protein YncE